MLALIFLCLSVSCLILCNIYLLYKNHELEKENLIMSCDINRHIKENFELRKELENVLPIEREGTRNNKKSTKLHHS